MATINKTVASLRITGEDLDPEEISSMLGQSSDYAQKKGDEIMGRNTGLVRVAKFGMWQLAAPGSEPGDLDSQISHILGKLTDDLSVWNQLAVKYDIDIFCGLFMEKENEGLCISPESLASLGERGIELGLDIYAGDNDHA